MSSTPTGKRSQFWKACTNPKMGYKEHYHPSTHNPNWCDAMEAEFRTQLSEQGYIHEILAEFGEEETGVFNKDKVDKDKTIDDYFELVQISREDQDKLLKDYSHGMKNKMQILINIIAHPKVILLDEPLTSLDVVVQDEMKKLLRSLKNDHIIIFSTHILEIAMDLCEEIVILNNKKLELVQQSNLNHQKYKDKIIKMLKDNKDD